MEIGKEDSSGMHKGIRKKEKERRGEQMGEEEEKSNEKSWNKQELIKRGKGKRDSKNNSGENIEQN